MGKKASAKKEAVGPSAAGDTHPDPAPSKVMKKKKSKALAADPAADATVTGAPSPKVSPKASPKAAPAPAPAPETKETAPKGKKRKGASDTEAAAQKKVKSADGGAQSAGAASTGAKVFRDQTLTCGACGDGFVWAAKEQQFFAEMELFNPPKRCRECRALKNGEVIRCRKCGEPGHYDRDCTKGSSCYNCGEGGHQSKECSKAPTCRQFRAGKCARVECKFAHTK
eukprot:TRINITY_DN4182_c0_g1_i1.p2 TRINITY_DN4182_c0_g1~~TRINITY_DN4182_c0_g1_i1.p2  ORF type:complete len:233 (-),score=61.49 TRINITY_DN4182_c0_g1_i1:176-853(-)